MLLCLSFAKDLMMSMESFAVRDSRTPRSFFHPFVTRLEERFACRRTGDLEERLSGAESHDGRPGVVCSRNPL